uniref:Large ribosomal subunit protein mL52 n=1 Tax=Cyanistes caeruleus TaxID=156563 RepID=A0A8C0V9Y9_CYACU
SVKGAPSGPGPLRDLPDWSFADGRPSPPWRGQLRRLREQRELAVSDQNRIGPDRGGSGRFGAVWGVQTSKE